MTPHSPGHDPVVGTTVRGLAELAVLLPFALGYDPGCSLVVVCLVDGRMDLVARFDLDPDAPVATAMAPVVDVVGREIPDEVVILALGAPVGARPLHDHAAREAARILRDAGVLVGAVAVVDGDHLHRLDRPGAPVPLPTPAEVPAVADHVAAGVHPRPTRAALEAAVEADERAVETGAAVPDEGRTAICEAWAQLLDRPVEAVPPQVLATAVAALVDPMVRDGLMLHLCPVGGEDPSCGGWRPAFSAAVPDRPWLGEDTAAERRLLLERLRSVAARTPDRWAAPVLTVLANTAWWVGDGTLAAVALARALRVDPGYRLAVLLDQLVSLGVRREAGRSRAA